MKAVHRRRQGKAGLDLIEEATHLLRTAPAATLALYYLGGIPFVLGLLYFWADMSRNPLANQHLADGALGVALLFVWMKSWQVVFAVRMRAQIAALPPPPCGLRQWLRIVTVQGILQPSGLFLLPVALVVTLPFGWVYAFYQNVTMLGDGKSDRVRKVLTESWRQAVLWPRQNHVALVIMSGFAFFVFLSSAITCFALPSLFKMLFGIESVFSRSPISMMNSTFFAAIIAVTYLCVDPILKTIYVLRCFYGEALASGEDLKAQLKQAAPGLAAGAAILLAVFLPAAPAVAADAPLEASPIRQSASPAAPAPELDRTINRVIHQARFTWRMPREKTVEPDSEPGVIGRFLDRVGRMLRRWGKAVIEWVDNWMRKLFSRRQRQWESGSGYGWIFWKEILLYGLVAAAALALAFLLFRVWRNRQRRPETVASEAILPVPDLADENVGADQLPEDGWTTLARELLERGEWRLAMRAFYLASLAHLAGRNLISIARYKSNRDYERELRRRGHAFPDLLAIFSDNIVAFERVWYGTHEVSRGLLDGFAANVERIRTVG